MKEKRREMREAPIWVIIYSICTYFPFVCLCVTKIGKQMSVLRKNVTAEYGSSHSYNNTEQSKVVSFSTV